MFAIRVIWILYFLTLFTATHFPIPELLEETVSLFDKLIHASAYFILAILTFLALGWGPPLQRPSIWAVLGLLSYAVLDEFLQGFVNRTPDLEDLMSDSAGIFIAFCLMRFLTRQHKTAPPPADTSRTASPSNDVT